MGARYEYKTVNLITKADSAYVNTLYDTGWEVYNTYPDGNKIELKKSLKKPETVNVIIHNKDGRNAEIHVIKHNQTALATYRELVEKIFDKDEAKDILREIDEDELKAEVDSHLEGTGEELIWFVEIEYNKYNGK